MRDSRSKSQESLRKWALSFLFTPLILFPFFIYFAIDDPRFIIKAWEIYALLFGLPWLISIAIFVYLRRSGERPTD